MATVRKRNRKWEVLTDDDILQLLVKGTIWIVGLQVYSRGKLLTENERKRYRFVRLHCGNKRRKIAKHRLIWMAAHGRTIPDGSEIHHRGSKSQEHPCRLQCLTAEQHFEETYGYPPDWE